MKRAFWLVLAAWAMGASGCIVAGGSAQARRTFAHTAPWTDYERVVVRSRNGTVDLHVGSGTDVEVSGELCATAPTLDEASERLDELEVTVGPAPDEPQALVVTFDCPDWPSNRSASADMRVVLPLACPVDVHTRNGRVRARDLVGPVRLATSNGHVIAEDIDGDLHAESSNGALDVRNVSGRCELHTSNGRVRVHETEGSLRVETSNGHIEAEADPPADGEVILRTSNGSINATLPIDIAGDLRLHTSNGRTRVEYGDIPVQIRHESRTRVEATTNGGGPGRVDVTTSNGSVTVRFR